MQAIINPGTIAGTINAPASKSHTQRALAGALLHHGKTVIKHAGSSNDEVAAMAVIQQLGATINKHQDHLEIISNGIAPINNYINCGESGLAARLFTPIAALSAHEMTIQGTGSLLKRPMDTFHIVLPELGIDMPHFNGYIPFTVKGPLIPSSIRIDGSLSSQFLSGLLFAISHKATAAVRIEVDNLKSTPYIDLTLEVLQQFGKPVTHDSYKYFYIDPAKFYNTGDVTIDIEGDWSNAAFWLVAGAINGKVMVQGLSLQSVQADKAVLQLLADIDTRLMLSGDTIEVRTGKLKNFEFDATHCPDLFPILGVLAGCCEGESCITGIHRLHHKESNRAESVSKMLQQFGIPFSIQDDSLCISGVGHFKGNIIDAHNDHRIAMAASIGALRADGPVTIKEAESINKSYPHFYEDLSRLGINCTIKD